MQKYYFFSEIGRFFQNKFLSFLILQAFHDINNAKIEVENALMSKSAGGRDDFQLMQKSLS